MLLDQLELVYHTYPELNILAATNSCDGSFGQWKYKIKIHRHLRLNRKKDDWYNLRVNTSLIFEIPKISIILKFRPKQTKPEMI